MSDVQDCFEYITKNSEILTDNVSTKIYVNKIKNRATFKIKSGYCLEFLSPETMKLLGNTKDNRCSIISLQYC